MKKKRKGEMRSKHRDRTEWAWSFFPVYGLIVEDDDGLHAPLWGDCTLASRTKLQELVDFTAQSKAHPLLSHGKLSDALGDGIADVGNGKTLIEFVPDAYIAVRRRETYAATERRANRVRAILSATMFLRGGRATAFCGSPHEFAWFLAPRDATVVQGRPPQVNIRPVVNPNIVQRPIHVKKADLRTSVRTGAPIPVPETPTWDLDESHSTCRLLNAKRLSNFQERLIGAALLIQDASCTMSEFSRLQIAVTALERILNTSDYSMLERRLRSFFRGSRPDISALLAMRHQVTHEGRFAEQPEIERIAIDAVATAWIMFDVATSFSETLSGERFDQYVDAQWKARDLDRITASVLGDETYTRHVDLLHDAIRPLQAMLTVRGRKGTEDVAGSAGA